jgi:hypothetical protein
MTNVAFFRGGTATARVTRLAEFLRILRLIAFLSVVLKLCTIEVQNVWATFFNNKICVHIHFVEKNGLSYILGDFLSNSSGHPARSPPFSARRCKPFSFSSVHNRIRDGKLSTGKKVDE